MVRIELGHDELRPIIESVVRELITTGILPRQENRLLLATADEAAHMLGIAKRTLTDLPDIPSLKIGRSRRYPVEGLRAWILERQRPSGEIIDDHNDAGGVAGEDAT